MRSLHGKCLSYKGVTARCHLGVSDDAAIFCAASDDNDSTLRKKATEQAAMHTLLEPAPTVSTFADTSAIPPHLLLSWPPPAPYSNVVKDLGKAAAASLDS